jgi:hypothetical protein
MRVTCTFCHHCWSQYQSLAFKCPLPPSLPHSSTRRLILPSSLRAQFAARQNTPPPPHTHDNTDNSDTCTQFFTHLTEKFTEARNPGGGTKAAAVPASALVRNVSSLHHSTCRSAGVAMALNGRPAAWAGESRAVAARVLGDAGSRKPEALIRRLRGGSGPVVLRDSSPPTAAVHG